MGAIQLRLGGGCPGTPAPTQTGQEHPSPCRRSALGSFGSGEGTAVAASRCPVGSAGHLSTPGAPTCTLGGLPCTRAPPAQHLCPAVHPKLYGVMGCPRRPGKVQGLLGQGQRFPVRRAWPPAQVPSPQLPQLQWGWGAAAKGPQGNSAITPRGAHCYAGRPNPHLPRLLGSQAGRQGPGQHPLKSTGNSPSSSCSRHFSHTPWVFP